jgi:AP-1 complex subunit gamma-1
MPAIDVTKLRNRQNRVNSAMGMQVELMGDDDTPFGGDSALAKPAPKQQASAAAATPNLLDLDDIFGGGGGSSSGPSAPVSAAPASTPAPAAAVDLLADLFSTGPSSAPPAPPAAPFGIPATNSSSSSANDLLGLMDFGAPAAAAPKPAAPQNPKIRAYEKNGLSVDLEISKPNKDDPSVTFIAATVRNATAIPLTNFLFLAAFPKYIKLKMEPASSDVVPPHNGGVVTQLVKIQNAMHGEKPVLMRIKLDFMVNGSKVEDMAAVSSFPPNI